jgi:[glutamine synthetase] adenylyltransferase / [glutamine synthetase]-adenylyl-L-tyrosine phosphorylase
MKSQDGPLILTKKASDHLPILENYLKLLERPLPESFKLRHTDFIEAATANYFKKSTAEDVCKLWSQTADTIIKSKWQEFGLDKAPMAVFAVGKLGALELNLSSDVDLMFIAKDGANVEKRQLAAFISSLSQHTEFGFLFRVDVDLRPGGRLGPLVSSVSQFEDYYGNFGETWERLALIRLRPIFGNDQVIKSIQDLVPKFCFRKHLDYTLLEDLKNLRKKIQHHYPEKGDKSFNLKLGIGGIRDIELFVHALQVIHGGRIPELRTRSTSEALAVLKKNNLLPERDVEFLHTSYWYYRYLENWIQSAHDQQTHMWTSALTDNSKLIEDEIQTRSATVNKLVTSLLGEAKSESEIPADIEAQITWLSQHGIAAKSSQEAWRELISNHVLSRKTERDEQQRLLFLQTFVLELEKLKGDSELALSLLLDFSKATRAKATFFTLLNREPNLIKELAWLFSISPYLSQILIARPELIDSFFLKSHAPLSADLTEALDQLGDFKLLTELVSSSRFLTEKSIDYLTNSLSNAADTICKKILELTHEEIRESTLSILTMGKWAGLELGLRSDLDFVFVADNEVSDEDHKVARRIVNRLTQKNRGGSLYALDFRLRPSGNAGLIVVTKQQLEDYIKNTAKAWERQAYLKSRNLIGDLPTRTWAVSKKTTEAEFVELAGIKEKLFIQNKPSHAEHVDLKYAPGGMVDIEFLYQWTALKNQLTLPSANTIDCIRELVEKLPDWARWGRKFSENYQFLRTIEQLQQLVAMVPGSSLDLASSAFKKVSLLLQSDPEELAKKIKLTLSDNAKLVKDLDPNKT